MARLLALHFDRSAHVDIDMVYHHFTVIGRADPAGQGGEVDQQADLAVSNAVALARNYVAAGYVCELEGAIVRRSQILTCQREVAPHPLHLIVLARPPSQRETGCPPVRQARRCLVPASETGPGP